MDSPKPPAKGPIGPALRALAARARRDLGPHHPGADEIVAYHERKLDEREAERVREHLALCSDCAGLLLELAAFSEPAPPEASGLTTPEVEEAWRDFASRLAAPAPGSRTGDPARQGRAAIRVPWALAASVLMAVVALSAWVATLHQELRARSRPRVDAVLANLEPRGEGTRGEAGSGDERPREDRPATLILHASPARIYAGYELQIDHGQPGAGPVWQGRGMHPRDLGVFVLELPAGALPPGKYLVRLYGVEAGRRDPLADYDLVIAGSAPDVR